jgi:hypothetical protein
MKADRPRLYARAVRRSLVMLVAVAGIAAGACGGSDDSPDRAATTATTPSTAGTSTTSTAKTAAGSGAVPTGTGKSSSSGGNASSPSGQASPDSGGGRYPGVFAETFRLCSQSSVERVAGSVGTKSTNHAEIARAMARGYLPKYRARAFSGCIKGLKIAAALK